MKNAIETDPNTYSYKEIDGEFFVFSSDDPEEPFDGPMSLEEAQILVDNCNADPNDGICDYMPE